MCVYVGVGMLGAGLRLGTCLFSKIEVYAQWFIPKAKAGPPSFLLTQRFIIFNNEILLKVFVFSSFFSFF